MKRQKWRALMSVTAVIFVFLSFSACNTGGGASNPQRDSYEVLETETPEKNVIANSVVKVDASNTSQGYIGVMYTGSNEKVKLQITFQDTTYTYNLLRRGEYEIFPLTLGNGTYKINVYENIEGTKYSLIFAEGVDAELENEFLPFLYPNQYVSYTKKDKVVELSNQVSSNCADDLSVVQAVYDYCVSNLDYDYSFAENIPTSYVPDISEVISTKKGICFDYASLMTAMLRCQGIPTKLVVGYSGSAYHAWISVYTEETGWVDEIIKFNGSEWVRMDPTYASTSNASGTSINKYVGDGSNYNALYYY